MVQQIPKGFSIVLCTYNGKPRLAPTLEYIAALAIPEGYGLEVLLVDNASNDGTEASTVENWYKLGQPFPLIVLREDRPGKGYAVETGYDAAKYSYILTVDDDNWLDSQYLTKSVELLNRYSDVGLLQGTSEAVFEASPPQWFDDPLMSKQLVVGGQLDSTGYFPVNQFHVWGAGLVIYRQDWLKLRQLGFSFLTSKMPGKAAGEDSELGLALCLLGRRVYYSSELKFKHFMPAGRLQWSKLKQNFDVFGYVSYYFSLYEIVIKAARIGNKLSAGQVKQTILKELLREFKRLTIKQHLAFWLKPQQQYYQLLLVQYYSRLRWTTKLFSSLESDVEKMEKWVLPVVTLARG